MKQGTKQSTSKKADASDISGDALATKPCKTVSERLHDTHGVSTAKTTARAIGTATDPRARRTESQILAAFDQLIAEKELKKITVTDLTKRAGISRKTFYLHYSSIDNLVDELIRIELEHIAESLSTVSIKDDGTINVEELLMVLGEELLISFNRRTKLVQSINTNQLINRLRPILTATLAKKDSLGLSEKLGPYLDMFVAFFCAGLLSVYHQWVSTDSDLPMETVSVLAGAAVAGGADALIKKAHELGISSSI